MLPENKPLAIEKNNCQQFNMQEISSLKSSKFIVSLARLHINRYLNFIKYHINLLGITIWLN